MQKVIEALGGRKSFMSLLTVLLGTVVEFVKPGGLSESYVMLLVGIVGVFSGANALVSWRGMSVGQEQPSAEPAGASKVEELQTAVINEVTRLDGEVAGLKQELATQAEALNKASNIMKAMLTIKQS